MEWLRKWQLVIAVHDEVAAILCEPIVKCIFGGNLITTFFYLYTCADIF